MKKILVTGSCGLIGRAISQKLLAEGYEVLDCDIRLHNNSLNFASEEILEILNGCQGIIHLAAISRVIHGEIYPDLCRYVNIDLHNKFISMVKNLAHKPWFIYGSSREVYGAQDILPVKESQKLQPMNNYAITKLTAENTVNSLKNAGFNISILRFSNVYGGMMDHYNRVVPAFCIASLKNSIINIEGEECIFDFTYIDDVTDGIFRSIKFLETNNQSLPEIHLTTCEPTSLQDLANLIIKITNSKSKIQYSSYRNFDVKKFYGDFSNAYKILGWKPKYFLEDGLTKFIKDIKTLDRNQPKDIEMVIYENIKSYSWLPSLL